MQASTADDSASADARSIGEAAKGPVRELDRMPLPGPKDDVRPKQGLLGAEATYMQGSELPATSSVLISNSKYLNNPYYREAYATQALRRHGPDLPATYMVPLMIRALQEVTDPARVVRLFEEEKQKNPQFAEWLGKRRYTSFKRENLVDYQPGTLGNAIHEFLNIPDMEMEFVSNSNEVKSDLEYFIKRRSGLHDIEHMVTGFGPNTAGENALAMLNVTANARFFTPELAQYMSASNVWITSTGYNRTALHYHHALPTYLEAMQRGIAAGLSVRQPLFMVPWEDYLGWPLEDIAEELGIVRGPGADWDWTTDATTG